MSFFRVYNVVLAPLLPSVFRFCLSNNSPPFSRLALALALRLNDPASPLSAMAAKAPASRCLW